LIVFQTFLWPKAARPGARRPAGSSTLPRLRDALTAQQIDALVQRAVDKANDGDSLLLKFMLEQVFGKAPQPLTGDKDNPIYVKGVAITVRRK
jgi:hypothetical protein